MNYKNTMIIAVILSSVTAIHTYAQETHKTIDDMEKKRMEYRKPDSTPGMCAKQPMEADGFVRLSKIEVFPQFLGEYMKYATEVGEVSLRTEPGVLTMYAVGEKDNPCKITILETYASKAAYNAHIASEHFQKYKQGTLHMVKSLVLSDQMPLNPANRIENYIQ